MSRRFKLLCGQRAGVPANLYARGWHRLTAGEKHIARLGLGSDGRAIFTAAVYPIDRERIQVYGKITYREAWGGRSELFGAPRALRDRPSTMRAAIKLLEKAEREGPSSPLWRETTAPSLDSEGQRAADRLASSDLEGVATALAEVLSACKGGDLRVVEVAAVRVQAAANELLHAGYDSEGLKAVLSYWGQVTPGAPKINIISEGN